VPPLETDRAAARAEFGLQEGETCVCVFGGSLGARSINQAAIEGLADPAPGLRVLHLSGHRDFAGLTAPGPHYDLRPYYQPFGRALLAADLAVARAGGSIFEVAAYGLPAILVPYPHASADHQSANARWMERAGAAVVVADPELTAQRLREEIRALVADHGRLSAMAAASAGLARPDAAQAVAREVLAQL
jgi:UDP-N-acetylglucosamine--N-acetylmuramyl-(pentapeptide) pyrophosphoryl-undecaprenol N-acetylglucosamine transferase